MRLFTGIAIPKQLSDQLSWLLDRLRPTAHIKWAPIYNLHITTKFIGEWPEHRLAEILEALQPLRELPAPSITVQGLGWFQNSRHPNVLWAGLEASAALPTLAGRTDEVLAKLGIRPEKNAFRPHITLARIHDSSVPLEPLRQSIAQLPSLDFGHFVADRFALYQSKPGPSSSIYTQLADFPLQQ